MPVLCVLGNTLLPTLVPSAGCGEQTGPHPGVWALHPSPRDSPAHGCASDQSQRDGEEHPLPPLTRLRAEGAWDDRGELTGPEPGRSQPPSMASRSRVEGDLPPVGLGPLPQDLALLSRREASQGTEVQAEARGAQCGGWGEEAPGLGAAGAHGSTLCRAQGTALKTHLAPWPGDPTPTC